MRIRQIFADMTEKNHTNSGVQCTMKSLDVEFEGVVPTDVRSEIVKELIKYILYERGQIPMYYDQIKDCCRSEEKVRLFYYVLLEQLLYMQILRFLLLGSLPF